MADVRGRAASNRGPSRQRLDVVQRYRPAGRTGKALSRHARLSPRSPVKFMPVIDTGGWAGSTTGIMTKSRLLSRMADDVRRLATRNLVGARSLARTSCRAIAGGRAASPTDRAAATDAAGAPIGAATAGLNVLHRVLICERVKQTSASRERRRRSGREGHPNKHSQPQHKLSHDIRPSCDVANNGPAAQWIMRRHYKAGNISRPELANLQTRMSRCTRRRARARSAERPFIQTQSRSNAASTRRFLQPRAGYDGGSARTHAYHAMGT